SLIAALLACGALAPGTAQACALPVTIQDIDAMLRRGDLPPDQLQLARTLRARGQALTASGKLDEGRAGFRQLFTMLGLEARCSAWSAVGCGVRASSVSTLSCAGPGWPRAIAIGSTRCEPRSGV